MNNRRLILNVIIIFLFMMPLFLPIFGGKDLPSALAAEPPLIKAVKNYDYDLVEKLIKGGAGVNVKDKEGNTPFKMVNQASLRLKHRYNCKKCAGMIKTIVKILNSAGAK